jgi:hypothetical protein
MYSCWAIELPKLDSGEARKNKIKETNKMK